MRMNSTPAVKLIQPVFRKPDLSLERFQYHWRAVHAPIAAEIDLLQRYVQDHRIAPEVPGFQSMGCDGVVEVWFEKIEDAAALGEDPTYLEGAHLDEPRFLDLERSVGFLAHESVVRDQSGEADTAKAVLFLRKSEDLDDAEFQSRWERYAEAQLESDGLTAFSHCTVIGEEGERPFEAVDFMSWSDALAFDEEWASEAMAARLAPLAEFADMTQSYALLTQPIRVI